MERSALLVVSLLALTGCKSGGGSATAPSTPAPSAPPAAPPVTRVLAIAHDNVGVPLACFDASTKKLAAGADCNDLVSRGMKVRAGDKTTEVGSFADATCEPSGESANGFELLAAESGEPVVYPADTIVTRSSSSEEEVSLPDTERKSVESAVRASSAKATGPVRVHQALRADLDADGKPDVLYSVTVPLSAGKSDEGDELFDGSTLAFSGLLLSLGGAAPVVLESGEFGKIEVRGLVDLDGDRKPELWIGYPYYEGDGDAVHRLAGTRLEKLGAWGCGA